MAHWCEEKVFALLDVMDWKSAFEVLGACTPWRIKEHDLQLQQEVEEDLFEHQKVQPFIGSVLYGLAAGEARAIKVAEILLGSAVKLPPEIRTYDVARREVQHTNHLVTDYQRAAIRIGRYFRAEAA